MKEINAFIHSHRIADVVAAIKGAGCRNVSVVDVKGLLKRIDPQERHYSLEIAEEVIVESKLQLLCEDDQADRLVEIIARVGRTGQDQAGVVYVTDVLKAVTITGPYVM
ncbi:P-II family nitrogen regulator [Thermithiobacillus plumbiphilus]|uniref:P-II family nitrogen regulator n=1 Tax=Thermithiobacillus plumbiphilus TaxID=1729899 RepID=A0ABU9D776_9PROT